VQGLGGGDGRGDGDGVDDMVGIFIPLVADAGLSFKGCCGSAMSLAATDADRSGLRSLRR
jgi:hypothetical protein